MKKYKGYTRNQLIQMALDIIEFEAGELDCEMILSYVEKGKVPDLKTFKRMAKQVGSFYEFVHGADLNNSCAHVHDDWRNELIACHKSLAEHGAF